MIHNKLELLIEAEDLRIEELQSLIDAYFSDLDVSILPPPQKTGRSSISELLLIAGGIAGSMAVNVASSFVYDFIVKLKQAKSGNFGKTPYAVIETTTSIKVEFRKEVDDKTLKRWIKLCLQHGGIKKITIANEPNY
jgi:hypothetical protein